MINIDAYGIKKHFVLKFKLKKLYRLCWFFFTKFIPKLQGDNYLFKDKVGL